MELDERYRDVRRATEMLAEPLSAEDCALQSMDDASPTKWHLGHTTWFFETLVLEPHFQGHRPLEPGYRVLFNSYYNSVGEQYERPRRGLLSRPSLEEVLLYRHFVDERLLALLGDPRRDVPAVAELVELGLNHEQQHQELILTDVKHALSFNPMQPAYRKTEQPPPATTPALAWFGYEAGVRHIGFEGSGFCFDNERPAHRVFVEGFELASRPATNADYLEFIEAGGYERPEIWLADGWASVQREGWRAPLYWQHEGAGWTTLSLGGRRPVRPDDPVCHVSHFEADAFARWSGARLPTEAEWETACDHAAAGHFVESGFLQPQPTPEADGGPAGLFGDVWEWTGSPYLPYPGFRPLNGAPGEYNGKFMSGQLVLRGGSCATPASHIRHSYRNFFYPHQRWQFSGIRLARDPD